MAWLKEPITDVRPVRNYIDGEWADSSGELRDVINPATGKAIARVPSSPSEEIAAAVGAARRAFPEWRRTPPIARARLLFHLKELMEDAFEEASRIQTQEHGKTIDESRGETRRGIENVETACGIPSLLQGDYSQDVASGIDEWVVPTPLGVFGIIAPFNFPWMIPLWSAPYAVAAGNCLVVKPSDEVPLSQDKIAQLVDEAGFPPGVWNVVHGGTATGSALLEHPDVAGITFVGSTPVGRTVYERCGATGKRVAAQCGAKNFLVILPDCNVDRTIAALMTSVFGNAGQRCLAGANCLIVDDSSSFYADFVAEIVERSSSIRLGYGLDESVQMGPLHDRRKKEKVLGYIDRGVEEGARLLLDGREPSLPGDVSAQCFLGPTVFEDVDPESSIGKEEIFGPVMSIMRTGTLDEALRIVNANPYGNGHCIFTQDGGSAREFAYGVESGNVGINIGVAAPMAFFPFGGMKDSFFGTLHMQGRDAIRFFTDPKVVIQRWL